jgi:hypothetical protein
MKYQDIFKHKYQFVLHDSTGVIKFQYQENEDKGEFIDHDGNVVAQLYENDKSKPYFIVAAMFMGDINFKWIPYHRAVSISGAHAIYEKKFIEEPKDK